MPEGVEVEITRKKLETSLGHPLLRSIDILDARLAYPVPQSIAFNTKLKNITRHGKVLQFNLDNGKNFSVSLGMTGSILRRVSAQNGARPRLVMNFANQQYGLFDVRRFGRFAYPGKLPRGLDVLSYLGLHRAPKVLASILANSPSPIKVALMDQNKIAGIGNIYANEILFEAKIHPSRRASSLSGPEMQGLWQAARKVLGKALELGGSSIKDFKHPDGKKGAFQNVFKVYGKKQSEPCPRCEKPLRVIRLGQRATIYCVCQK